MQQMDKGSDQLSSKIILDNDKGYTITLSIFDSLLQSLATTTEVTQEAMLKLPLIEIVTYNNKKTSQEV